MSRAKRETPTTTPCASRIGDIVSETSIRLGIGQRIELPLRTTDGRTVWALVSASPLHEPGGEYAGAIGMLTDITAARTHAGEGSHLAAIVRSSADSIIGMSTSGVIESWNEASTRLYGYSAEDALGRYGPELLSRDPAKSEALVAKAKGSPRHRTAVANTLAWAEQSAERGDLVGALAWLDVVAAIGDDVPDAYKLKRRRWIGALAPVGAERSEP
jgi:PAS domain-containing protein